MMHFVAPRKLCMIHIYAFLPYFISGANLVNFLQTESGWQFYNSEKLTLHRLSIVKCGKSSLPGIKLLSNSFSVFQIGIIFSLLRFGVENAKGNFYTWQRLGRAHNKRRDANNVLLLEGSSIRSRVSRGAGQ